MLLLAFKMVDRLVVQLQDLVSDLRNCKDPVVKNEIKTAKHCIQDADKLKQVWKPQPLNGQQLR